MSSGGLSPLEQVRQIEEELRLHDRAMAASSCGITIADARQPDMPLIYINEAFEAITGYPTAEVLGKNCRFLQGEDRNQPELDEMRAALKEGRSCRITIRNYRKDGSLFWNELFTAPVFDHEGQLTHYVGVQTDVTARKLAEEALTRKTIELERALTELRETQVLLVHSEKMSALGQMVAGVAHEINNPVGFVSSNLHTLGEYVNTLFELVDAYEAALGLVSLPAGAQAKLDAVRRHADVGYLRADALDLLGESVDGVKRVRQIVQDLKDFSHVDAGEWKRVDLNACIASTLNVVSNEIKYKAKVERDLAVLPEVLCNAPQISQVIMNLLVNAAQAIETSGIIRLATGAEGDWAWFEVADDGKGMSEEVKKRIFEPFYTTKAVGQGTGLGLSVSYGIVGKHGGRIEVFSAPDQGARFRVWLPVNGSREEAGAVAG